MIFPVSGWINTTGSFLASAIPSEVLELCEEIFLLEEGCLSLLEDGAKAVVSGEDVLEEYALRFRQREKDPPGEPVLRQVVRRLGRLGRRWW